MACGLASARRRSPRARAARVATTNPRARLPHRRLRILAVSLDLILGYGGMVSFGHAAYFGAGAYVVGALVLGGVHNGFLHFAPASPAGLPRLRGGHAERSHAQHLFHHAHFAFAQMLFYLAVGPAAVRRRRRHAARAPLPVRRLPDLANLRHFYYFALPCSLVGCSSCDRIVRSRFGMVLRGCMQNERACRPSAWPPMVQGCGLLHRGRHRRAGRLPGGEPERLREPELPRLEGLGRRDHDDRGRRHRYPPRRADRRAGVPADAGRHLLLHRPLDGGVRPVSRAGGALLEARHLRSGSSPADERAGPLAPWARQALRRHRRH